MTAVYGSQSWHSVGKEPVSTHWSRTGNLGYQSSPIPDVAGTGRYLEPIRLHRIICRFGPGRLLSNVVTNRPLDGRF